MSGKRTGWLTHKFGLPSLMSLLLSVWTVILPAQGLPADKGTGAVRSPATVHVTSHLVVLDVVVLDRSKRPVHGLKASDFRVLEDGKTQTIGSFEEHSAAVDARSNSSLMSQSASPGIFTNAVASSDLEARDVLLIDALNTTASDREYARSQLIEFLKLPGARNQTAVFAMQNDRLVMVQGFTADTERLKAAVRSNRVAPVSSLLNDPTGMGGDGPLGEQTGPVQELQLQLRARYTLDALDRLSRYLAALPGRKRLFWLSGSFPLSVTPDVRLEDVSSPNLETDRRLRTAMNLFAQSRVVIFLISTRGVPAPFANDASNSDMKYVKRPDLLAVDSNAAGENVGTDQQVMEQIARATGGRAIYNSNGLSQAIARTIDDGANFYTLSYRPDHEPAEMDARYREIGVQCVGRNYSLEYRNGYFTGQLGKASEASDAAKIDQTAGRSDLRGAMQRGAPDELGVIFKARVLPVGAKSEPQVVPSNRPSPKAKGPWRTYQIDLAADPRAFRMHPLKDGSYTATIELAAVVYAEDSSGAGEMVNSVDETVSHSFSRAQLEEASRTGLAVYTQISVPKRGNYVVRIGIRDGISGSIGALELSVALVKDLPALPAHSE